MNCRIAGYLRLLGSLSLLAAWPLCGQDIYTRFEFGAQFSTVRLTNPDLKGTNYSGFGGRFDWNLNRRLAFESQLDFFPEHAQPLLSIQGGQTLQAVFGLRAKAVQTRRLSVFGLIRPGFFHFTDVLYPSASSATGFGERPETHFVLNLGGGLEYYLNPRWALRADIEGDPYRVPNSTVVLPGGSGFSAGKIDDTTRFSFGVAYRPGALIENERETNVPGKWEFGPLFSTMFIGREAPTDGVRTEPGFGGYASYRFYHVFYFDSDLLYFPRGSNSSGPHDGGDIFEGLFGIKGGIRRNHFGIFGKVRPGFNSYSQALSAVSQTGQESFERSTNFVLDLGGIVEFYPAEHGTLRLEAGDTHIYFNTRDVNLGGTVVPAGGGKLQHTIQFIVGYGWRF
ncbi:MAG TPA: outer membrane beta-barrel protein [Candidatus Limnocylindrales bacterium]|nr:outer membrane beta-barrel protein [Candidatus Limnocylindrales bacterium]